MLTELQAKYLCNSATTPPVSGHLLEPVIREHIKELKKVGIEVNHA